MLLILDPFFPYIPAELSPNIIVPLFSPSVPAVIPVGTVPEYCLSSAIAATFTAPGAAVITEPFRYTAEFSPTTSVPSDASPALPVYSSEPPFMLPNVYVEPAEELTVRLLFIVAPGIVFI